jgi:hypothetical protein
MDTMSKLLGVNRGDAVSDNKRSWELQARKVMRAIKRELETRAFEVSAVRYNAGGSAVMGEVTFHARLRNRPSASVYVMAHHNLLDGRACIMFRFEEWPEYLGAEKGHKRMGPNRFTMFYNADITAIVNSATFDSSRAI